MQYFYSSESMKGFLNQQEQPQVPQREHPALPNIKFLNLFYFFSHLTFLDRDSYSGSLQKPNESGSNPGPDPKHCPQQQHRKEMTIRRTSF